MKHDKVVERPPILGLQQRMSFRRTSLGIALLPVLLLNRSACYQCAGFGDGGLDGPNQLAWPFPARLSW